MRLWLSLARFTNDINAFRSAVSAKPPKLGDNGVFLRIAHQSERGLACYTLIDRPAGVIVETELLAFKALMEKNAKIATFLTNPDA